MVNVIVGGTSGFDAVLYPEHSPNIQTYLYNQVNNISQMLTDTGRQFMESARMAYEQVNSSQAMALARAAMRSAKGLFHPNQIIQIDTLEGLQSAQPIMQRWIMSDPEVRHLYQTQQCAGYGSTYVDTSPGKIGKEDYSYRILTNGVVMENEDGELFATHYYEDLLEGDRQLTPWEQHDALSTNDLARLWLFRGHDITDVFQGKL